ncbi:hypothetical protein JCM17380_04510 [Desulfosporosinus burensis]
METIFHHDPRIEEWVNQITEKIFTVCLLSGVDSDAEFQQGSLIVTKIASVLLGLSTFPSEYLEDGLRQLLEQQLPDARVINNFPTFRDTMNRMLHEGISKVMESHKIAAEKIREEVTEEVTEEATEEVTEEVVEVVAEKTTEEDGEEVIISNDSAEGELKVTLSEAVIEDEDVSGLISETKATPNKELKPTHTQFQSNGLMSTPQVYEQAERLKHVLSFTFANKKVTWNSKLMGQTFLAQVEDTLICLQDPYQPFDMQIYIKEGWKVVLCTTEDLKFPRRLERKIRQCQRLGKRS